jgi:hypothetical protein
LALSSTTPELACATSSVPSVKIIIRTPLGVWTPDLLAILRRPSKDTNVRAGEAAQ